MHKVKFKATLHEKLKREVVRACVNFFQLGPLYPLSGVLFLFLLRDMENDL